MKIALDASPLTVSTGGIARYTSRLACALAHSFPENTYWLLADRPFPLPEDAPPNLLAGEPARTAVQKRWWSIGLPRELMRLEADLFHGTDFSVPYLPLRPSVMTIHDLSPWPDSLPPDLVAPDLFPNDARTWQPGSSRIRRRTATLLRARLPSMIITPSRAIREAVIDRFKWPADRIVAIPLAASAHFRPVSLSKPARPYFAFVGTLEPRKNIPRLVAAWREVRRTHSIDLVIAGRRREDFPPIPAEPGLQLLGAIPDSDLPAFYSSALAVVYPSLYEGFGLPVLEAMQCGALVVTSRDPAISEVAAGAAIQVDAVDVRSLAEALLAIAANPKEFADLRSRALARASRFSWTDTAKLTQAVYVKACGLESPP